MTNHGRFGLPPEAQILMAAGDFIPGDGMRMAVWAFAVLKYVAPNTHLVLVGDGPERHRVKRLAWAVIFDDMRAHSIIDAHPLSLVGEADIVWGTHTRGGVEFLKAAASLGKPSLAFRTPETERLQGLILTPPGDPVALATATRKVLGSLFDGGHPV